MVLEYESQHLPHKWPSFVGFDIPAPWIRHGIAMFLPLSCQQFLLPQAGWAGLSLVCQAGIGAVQAQKQALWMSVTLDMHNKTRRNKHVYIIYIYVYIYMIYVIICIYIYICIYKPWEWHIEAMTQCWNGASWARTQTGPANGPKLSTSGFQLSQAKRKGGRSFEEFRWVSTAEAHDFSSPTVSSCLRTCWCISNASSQIIKNIIHVNMGISQNFHYKPSSYWGSHG